MFKFRHTRIDEFPRAVTTQPNPGDVVLGGGAVPAIGGMVLGGLVGVKRRLANAIALPDRIAALQEASCYGSDGLDLLIGALDDRSLAVQKVAYQLLQSNPSPTAHQALRHFDRYQLFECLYILTGHTSGITAVALSANGETAISAGRDAKLILWDVRYGEEILTISEPRFIYGIAISPDGRTFTAKLSDRTYKAWDVRSGNAIELEEFSSRSIASVTTTPHQHQHGKHLISGSQNLIRIWNLTQGREVRVLQGHGSLVTAVAIAPDRSILVSGSEDKTIRVWGMEG